MKFFTALILILNVIAIFSSKFGIVEGVVGGRQDPPGTRSYQVSIQANGKHICGGALISNLHALSAAICFVGNNELFIDKVYNVVGGVENLNDANRVIALVDKISIPRDYKRTSNNRNDDNYISPMDIAVLKFSEKLHFTQLARMTVILLPQESTRYSKFTKETGTVTGYGVENYRNSDGDRHIMEVCQDRCINLKAIDSTILVRRSCQALIQQNIHDNHFCARISQPNNTRPGLCYGDVGAPFAIGNMLFGILIKHRRDCNENYLPSMYTSVTSVLVFIKKAMEDADMRSLIRLAVRKQAPTEGMVEFHRFL